MITLPKYRTGQDASQQVLNAPLYVADTNFNELALQVGELVSRVSVLELQEPPDNTSELWTWVSTGVNLAGADATQLFGGTCPTVDQSVSGVGMFPDASELMCAVYSGVYLSPYPADTDAWLYVMDKKIPVGHAFLYGSQWGLRVAGTFVSPESFVFRGKNAYPSFYMSILAWR